MFADLDTGTPWHGRRETCRHAGAYLTAYVRHGYVVLDASCLPSQQGVPPYLHCCITSITSAFIGIALKK